MKQLLLVILILSFNTLFSQQVVHCTASAEIVSDISLIELDSTNNIKVISNAQTYYNIQTEFIKSEKFKEYLENKILIYN